MKPFELTHRIRTVATAACVAIGVVFAWAGNAQAGPERVQFPSKYEKNYTLYAVVDNAEQKQVRRAWANPAAFASVLTGDLTPGSQLLMALYKAELDESGEPLLDENGRFIQGDLAAFAVMEKGIDWGRDYPEEIRNGDWEYAVFAPDGTLKTDVDLKPCFECHKALEDSDYQFLRDQLIAEAEK